MVSMQIQNLRVYERHGLVEPDRTAGGTRLYSLDDIDRLTRIRELLADGLNLAGIARVVALEAKVGRLRSENRRLRRRRPERELSGSLLTCWEARPVSVAVHRSRSAGSSTPASESTTPSSSRACRASRIDSAEGAKPGAVCWNSSWKRAGSSAANDTKSRAATRTSSHGSPDRSTASMRSPSWR